MSTGINRSRNSSVSTELSFRGNKKSSPRLPSINFKSTKDALRGAIAQSLDAASKALGELRNLRDDHQAGEVDCSLVDYLRKKMLALLMMLDGDEYFLGLLDNVQLLLSEKERSALRKGVLDLSSRCPREDMVSGLRLGVTELETMLTTRSYPYSAEVPVIHLADICKNISTSRRENGEHADDYKSEHFPIFLSSSESSDSDHDIADASKETVEDTVTKQVGIKAVPSALGEESRSALSPIQPSIPQTNGNKRGRALSFPQEFDSTGFSRLVVPRVARPGLSSFLKPEITVCPVCSNGHDILDCNSPKRSMYCAKYDLCIICTSDSHNTFGCPLRIPEISEIAANVSQQAGADVNDRFESPKTRISGITHNHHDPPRKESIHSVFENRVEVPRFHHSNLNGYDDEGGRLYDPRDDRIGKGDHRRHLSFYDVETVLPQFNADPIKYSRFAHSFHKMVFLNPSLDDTLKFTLLEKKLVGKAKRFLIDLNDPRAALEATLVALSAQFENNYSAINAALSQFRQLTFHESDFQSASLELHDCKALIMKLREQGEDVSSQAFVRQLVEKLPGKVIKRLKPLYSNNHTLTVEQVFETYSEYLRVKSFADRFRPSVSRNSSEYPEESVMIMMEVPANPPPRKSGKKNQKPLVSSVVGPASARPEISNDGRAIAAPTIPSKGLGRRPAHHRSKASLKKSGVNPNPATFFRGPLGGSQ
ncbi:hypothetical protein CRE_29033 [Caenorhabditis remanei]|uniref:Uncharacterized protein n=1 Tax=Caenorhabditis remanei TaxID=31234 RepID=E3NA35_CAERE|nr:hypothetical protein CRE_29033 [Caenorhabditis remanei]